MQLVVVRGVMAVLSLGRGLVGMFAFTPVSRTVPLIQGGRTRGFVMGALQPKIRVSVMSHDWGELIPGRTRE